MQEIYLIKNQPVPGGVEHMKKMKPVYLIIIILILMVIVTLQYRENEKIRTTQGTLVGSRIDSLQFQVESLSKYLSSTKIPEKEYLDRISGGFSEDMVMLPGTVSSGMLSVYIGMIRSDLDAMSSNIKYKESEQELMATKQLALDKITILLNELNYIMDNCKTDNIKYYQLSNPNDPIMKKVSKEMLDYLNNNDIH